MAINSAALLINILKTTKWSYPQQRICVKCQLRLYSTLWKMSISPFTVSFTLNLKLYAIYLPLNDSLRHNEWWFRTDILFNSIQLKVLSVACYHSPPYKQSVVLWMRLWMLSPSCIPFIDGRKCSSIEISSNIYAITAQIQSTYRAIGGVEVAVACIIWQSDTIHNSIAVNYGRRDEPWAQINYNRVIMSSERTKSFDFIICGFGA